MVTRIRGIEVEVGRVVLALTWTAAGLMIVQIPMWVWSLKSVDRGLENRSREEKLERNGV
jgi:hypothetical protein